MKSLDFSIRITAYKNSYNCYCTRNTIMLTENDLIGQNHCCIIIYVSGAVFIYLVDSKSGAAFNKSLAVFINLHAVAV